MPIFTKEERRLKGGGLRSAITLEELTGSILHGPRVTLRQDTKKARPLAQGPRQMFLFIEGCFRLHSITSLRMSSSQQKCEAHKPRTRLKTKLFHHALPTRLCCQQKPLGLLLYHVQPQPLVSGGSGGGVRRAS